MLLSRTFFCIALLGFIGTGFAIGAQSGSSIFRVQESLVCSAHRPAQRTFFCPTGMQIHIVSAFHGPQAALIKTSGSLPEGVVPCHPLPPSSSSSASAVPSSSAVIVTDLTPTACLVAKDVTKPLKQLCERKPTCHVSPDQFASNTTLCRSFSNEMLIAYRCEPSPQMVQTRVICQDTYIEIKCTSYTSDESIVVLTADLVTKVDPAVCPNIMETPSSGGVCPSRLDVTAGLKEMCGRERTCSVMPDPAMLPSGYPSVCARRHLQLSYACVPPSVLEVDRTVMDKHLPRQQKSRQTAYQKKNRREQGAVNQSKAPILPAYQQEQRDPGTFRNSDFERAAYSAMMDEKPIPKSTPSTESSESVKASPIHPSIFSMFLGVFVGIAVLLIIILLASGVALRMRRQRADYARRKALSDHSGLGNGNFPDSEKMPQQQQQQQLQPQLQYLPPGQPPLGSGNSCGYQQSSDSGTGACTSITPVYMPHGMFTSEACWPAGLQSVPQGGNYFDDEVTGAAFPQLTRDSGSHGYIQLPLNGIANSHHSGLVCSHQSSTTTMNHSSNHHVPFCVPHTGVSATDNFSGAPRMRSPAVNSTISTESDRFSGHVSSQPSSFQPLYPTSGNGCTSPRSLHQLPQCKSTSTQRREPLWIGYDEGLAENNGEAMDRAKPVVMNKSMSFESLIEPPESFKSRAPSSGTNLEQVPPRMAQLRRLEKSCDGVGAWNWQE